MKRQEACCRQWEQEGKGTQVAHGTVKGPMSPGPRDHASVYEGLGGAIERGVHGRYQGCLERDPQDIWHSSLLIPSEE